MTHKLTTDEHITVFLELPLADVQIIKALLRGHTKIKYTLTEAGRGHINRILREIHNQSTVLGDYTHG